jgi:2-polyprenyl-6-methoxyphenol hydroxylase-like FAD-dependent oxidoreductase
MSGLRVLIVGAGLGGLGSALALKRSGVEDVIVLEKAQRLEHIQVGIGMIMWPNGVKALQELGVEGALTEFANSVRTVKAFDPSGKLLSTWDMTEIQRSVGAGTRCFVRGELHKLLTTALAEIDPAALQLDKEVVHFTQDGDGVTVTLRDGSEEHGDVLICADGLLSESRRTLTGQGRPEFPPYVYTTWNGVVPFADRDAFPDGTFYMVFGAGVRFNIYRTENEGFGDRCYWGVLSYVPERESDPGGVKGFLNSILQGYMRPVNELVAVTPDEDVRRFIFYGGKALPKLGEGRIMLLGDAAHAMTNTLGQGSGMAFEDSIVLARALSSGLDPVDGLRAYEGRRMARTDAALELIGKLSSTSAEETPRKVWIRNNVKIRLGFRRSLGAAYERWLADVDHQFEPFPEPSAGSVSEPV